MSTLKLKITENPLGLGFASKELTQQLVGLKIALPEEDFLQANPPSRFEIRNPNLNGFVVRREDIATALREAGKNEEAAYFEEKINFMGTYLTIRPKYCRLEGEDPSGFSKEELREYIRLVYGANTNDVGVMGAYLMNSGQCAILSEGMYHLEPL